MVFSSGSLEAHVVGCVKDDTFHDLDHVADDISAGEVSVQRCFHYCLQKKFKFAALQAGNQCFCGNAYGRESKYAPVADTECRTKCTGDSKGFCGGILRNSIYSIGVFLFDFGRGVKVQFCVDFCLFQEIGNFQLSWIPIGSSPNSEDL